MNATETKITCILSTFSPDDWKKFSLFIKSPYFVRGRDYSELFANFYKKYKSGMKHDEEFLEKVINNTFRKYKLNDQTIRNRLSEFSLLAEAFIRQKYFLSDRISGEHYLMKYYFENNLYKQFDDVYKSYTDKYTPAKISLEDFQMRMQIMDLKVVKDIANKEFEKGVSVYHNFALHQTAYLLKEFFCTAMEYSKLDELKVEYDFNPVKSVLQNLNLSEFIRKIENKDIPVLNAAVIYYYLYEILVNGKDDEYLEKLENIFIGNEDKYEEELRFSISNYMEHYYMDKYNKYELKNVRTFFKLQKSKLVNGKIAEVVHLHREVFFDNYVEIGLKAGEYDYVKRFIEMNIDSLPENVKDMYSLIANLRLYIYKKDYTKALSMIDSNSKYMHNIMFLTRKLLIEYEMGMIEEAILESDRIKHLLRRSKTLNQNQKTRISVFISNFIKLIKLKDNPEKKKLEEFMFTINKIKLSLPAYDWFREKVEEMTKKK